MTKARETHRPELGLLQASIDRVKSIPGDRWQGNAREFLALKRHVSTRSAPIHSRPRTAHQELGKTLRPAGTSRGELKWVLSSRPASRAGDSGPGAAAAQLQGRRRDAPMSTKESDHLGFPSIHLFVRRPTNATRGIEFVDLPRPVFHAVLIDPDVLNASTPVLDCLESRRPHAMSSPTSPIVQSIALSIVLWLNPRQLLGWRICQFSEPSQPRLPAATP